MFREFLVGFDAGYCFQVVDELGKLHLWVITEKQVDVIILAIELDNGNPPFFTL